MSPQQNRAPRQPEKTRQAAHPGSFRDPAGFVFEEKGILYRQINKAGEADFDKLINSGLYDELSSQSLLISHQEIGDPRSEVTDGRLYKIIQPRRVPFISYPYEWTFSQLKDAALLTLRLQQMALERGMILKDASAYNIQFIGCQPIFIDTLSFKIYEPGAPWEGYKQFCEHFIAPLSLAAYGSLEMLRTTRVFFDGIPIKLASNLLPARARLRRGLLAHIYLHAGAQKRYDKRPQAPKERKVSSLAMKGLLASLEGTVGRLRLSKQKTQWADYYNDTNYTTKSFNNKKKIVQDMLGRIKPAPQLVWDMGANDGRFSELAAERGAYTVSLDIDPMAVEKNYVRKPPSTTSSLILPLIQDLSNPSPALGWAHSERSSLVQRGPADAGMALALLHHLVIGNNLPLSDIAVFLSTITKYLIIEFVPKEDSKVQLLLRGRSAAFKENINDQYNVPNFEEAFAKRFELIDRQPVGDSQRIVYLYKTKAV